MRGPRCALAVAVTLSSGCVHDFGFLDRALDASRDAPADAPVDARLDAVVDVPVGEVATPGPDVVDVVDALDASLVEISAPSPDVVGVDAAADTVRAVDATGPDAASVDVVLVPHDVVGDVAPPVDAGPPGSSCAAAIELAGVGPWSLAPPVGGAGGVVDVPLNDGGVIHYRDWAIYRFQAPAHQHYSITGCSSDGDTAVLSMLNQPGHECELRVISSEVAPYITRDPDFGACSSFGGMLPNADVGTWLYFSVLHRGSSLAMPVNVDTTP